MTPPERLEKEAMEIVESLIAWYQLDTKKEKSFEKFIKETARRIESAEKRGFERAVEEAAKHEECAKHEKMIIEDYEKRLHTLEQQLRDNENGTNNFTTIASPEVLHAEYKRGFDEGYKQGEVSEEGLERKELEAKIADLTKKLEKYSRVVEVAEEINVNLEGWRQNKGTFEVYFSTNLATEFVKFGNALASLNQSEETKSTNKEKA